MGGFLLVLKSHKKHGNTYETDVQKSLSVFQKKKMGICKKINGSHCEIWLFNKINRNDDKYIMYDNGDYILSAGTVFYKDKEGVNALHDIYNDYDQKEPLYKRLQGVFCLIIQKNGRLSFFNDLTGMYHIYHNESKTIYSSSFIAILKSIKKKTFAKQEFYEYLFNDGFYGDKTFIQEIGMVNRELVHDVTNIIRFRENKGSSFCVNSIDERTYKENLSDATERLIKYFTTLKSTFGESISCGLSAGYDSRLILALFRKVGCMPNLNVCGDDQSTDVIIAKEIAKAEGLPIDHVYRESQNEIPLGEFVSHIKDLYYFNDGLGNHGVFDDGSDKSSRLERAMMNSAFIVGIGGEIYRNYWLLPNKPNRIKRFLRSRYDFGDYTECTEEYNNEKYFENFAEKIKHLLNTEQDVLSRKQIEITYPLLRLQYWAGMEAKKCTQYTDIIFPFAEPQIYSQSFDIPLAFKNYGKFEADLIKMLDPALAKYNSDYGHNFYDPVPLRVKMKQDIRTNIPFKLKYLRKKLSSQSVKRKKKLKIRDCLPYYLSDKYLRQIFKEPTDMFVNNYVKIDRIIDRDILSRALTVELSMNDYL